MYVFCVYPAMSKKSENLSDLDKKYRNKRHSSPFINVVKGVFLVVRVTCLRPPLLQGTRKVYSSSTNKAKMYWYSIFVQQMYRLQDKLQYLTLIELVYNHMI